MHMTLETDYAVRIMETLTRRESGWTPGPFRKNPGAPALCTENSAESGSGRSGAFL